MEHSLDLKLEDLRLRLRSLGSVAVAYSGGVDSTLLARVAFEVLGDRAVAVIGVSASLAPIELADAVRVAGQIGIRLVTLGTGELDDPRYVANAPDRCYFCKSELFGQVVKWAAAHGIEHVVDGLNLDDDPADRPGVRAADELRVRAPLREAGFTKADVREASRHFGLPTAEKPASPCLASRIPHGTAVTPERLGQVARAERFLRGLGFTELRVRHHGSLARVEVPVADLPRIVKAREDVARGIRAAGFRFVSIDLDGLRTGGANRAVRPEEVVV